MKNYNLLLLLVVFGLFNCQTSEKSKFYSEIIHEGNSKIEVIVVKGTPYEMGFLLGEHFKKQAKQTLQSYLNTAFKEEKSLTLNYLTEAWRENLPYIDIRIQKEMKGFSDGSGIELKTLQAAHALPFVSPYACSGVDVWGKATSDSCLYQIRNLDYSIDAGLQKFPLVVIYKPDRGFSHANITFAGLLTSHTGINEKSIVLGEKGESPKKEMPYSLKGKHFMTMFRSLLYDAKCLPDVENEIEHSLMIKRFYLFVADGKKKEEKALKYLISSPDSIKWHKWTDNDSTDIYVPKVFKDVTYYTMKNDVASDFIQENYGNLNDSKMVELSRRVAARSNLIDVVYNATNLEIWVACATEKQRASERDYIHVDLKKYFRK